MIRGILMGALVATLVGAAAQATEYTSDPSESEHVPVVVYDLFMARDSAERAMQADLEFAQNMARHHQGAVDMAVYYLNDPRGTNPVVRRLARAIIRNQAFEIAVLDVVREHVEEGVKRVAGVGNLQLITLGRGVDGLEHTWMFIKAPVPSAADLWLSPALRASEFDVQFARPMIEHHDAAVDMAMDYNTNPDGRSSVLGPMNIGIMNDQRFEIDLMRRIIARYPGDPAAVTDDPTMTELMHRSMSGMHGGH